MPVWQWCLCYTLLYLTLLQMQEDHSRTLPLKWFQKWRNHTGTNCVCSKYCSSTHSESRGKFCFFILLTIVWKKSLIIWSEKSFLWFCFFAFLFTFVRCCIVHQYWNYSHTLIIPLDNWRENVLLYVLFIHE